MRHRIILLPIALFLTSVWVQPAQAGWAVINGIIEHVEVRIQEQLEQRNDQKAPDAERATDRSQQLSNRNQGTRK